MAAKADDPNKTYTLEEAKERGAKVYAANCQVCHQPNGKGGGAFPALDGSKVVNGPKEGQYQILLRGKNAMPNWKCFIRYRVGCSDDLHQKFLG
jgi:cytochrome c oxidase subunit 2